MANEDKQAGSGLANGSLIAVALLATGTYLFQKEAPLQGARPAMTESSIQEPIKGEQQTIDARLWQDPFAAIAKSLSVSEKRELEQRCIEKHSDDIACSSPLTDGKTLVVAVTTPGAPYSEDAEHRRRTRYAVLAGLQRAGYRPVDARHIGYFIWTPREAPLLREDLPTIPLQINAFTTPPDWRSSPPAAELQWQPYQARSKPGETASDGPAHFTIVPYERFEWTPRRGNKTQATHGKILLLWIKEEALKQHPLQKLAGLKNFLREGGAFLQPNPDFKIIGPYSSDLLRDMVRQARHLSADTKPEDRPDLKNVEIYAYGSSAPDEYLLRNSSGATRPPEIIERYFSDLGIRFQRTVATDDTLARGVVGELNRRVPNKGPKGGDVALISEWDTFYGQTLPKVVARQLYYSQRHTDCRSLHSKVHNLTYMRGLDGQLPAGDATDDRKTASAAPEGEKQTGAADFFRTQNDSKGIDRPAGQGQYDYIRRMSEQLRQIDEGLRKNGGKLKAVGVLGSDVFDKLLVLRALRPAFPEALFFTTDFDEALTMDSELPWTRNLIVSSSFGPNLYTKLQGGVSPFRDTYQTSAFLATQLATNDALYEKIVDSKQIDKELKIARVFEIERSGHLLEFHGTPSKSSAEDRNNNTNNGNSAQRVATGSEPSVGRSASAESSPKQDIIQPIINDLYPTYRTESQLSLAAALAAGAILVLTLLRLGKVRRSAFVEVAILASGLAAGALACYNWEAFAKRLTENGEGEPLAMLQGVSVWPTVFLRCLGIVFALYFIWRAQKNLRDNLADIAENLNLEPPPKRPLRTRLLGVFDFSLGGETDRTSPFAVQAAWNAYARQEEFLLRVVRAAVYTFIMYRIMVDILAPLLGTSLVYVRSAQAGLIYFRITRIDFVLVLFVAFFVFDATFFCLLFVNKLRYNHSKWPVSTVKLFNGTLRLQGNPVHDWIDLDFVAKRTRCIASLIYFPFLLIALFIVSRSTAFADFAPSVTFLVAQGISLSIVFGCAVMLCWAAKAARDAARENLSDAIICAKGHCGDIVGADGDAAPDEGRHAEQLQALFIRVDQLKDGAFSPFSQQPLVRAVILPLGGFGWTALLERGIIPGL